jgi:serine-type D-Ala-D-Ala carboxypeptidase (penicillin-binding protein 5/6)
MRSHHYLGLAIISLALFAQANTSEWLSVVMPELKTTVYYRPVTAVPVRIPGTAEPVLTAQAVVVVDVDSGSRLYEKNPRLLVAPASTTKLMTALVALDTFGEDAELTVPADLYREGAHASLIPGEKLSLESLIKASLIQSANDAAMTLAVNHPAGVDGFVAAMNEKATWLGMNDSNFTNPMGFDHRDHFSTAFDLAILAREAMKDPFLREVVGTPEAVITDVSGKNRHLLRSTHQLIGKDPQVVGVKTGTTQAAGEVLITQVQKEDKGALIVMLGSQQRYAETLGLVDWVFNAYYWLSLDEIMASDN